jgi:hypothetical protein
MKDQLSAVPAVPSTGPLTMVEADRETAAERAAVTEPEHITVDVPTAVTVVYGAIAAILLMKELLAETFTKFPMHLIDRLETYASAALYAHTAWSFGLAPPAHLQELLAQVTKRRFRLVSVMETAVIHELVPADALDELQGPKGHKNVATDLMGAAEVLLNHWAALDGKVPVTRSELDQDRELGRKLLQALGQRDQAPSSSSHLAMERKRAFTLMAFAYSEARAGIAYVRRHAGDVDRIAPSIYAGRGGSKRKEDETEEPAPAAAVVDADTVPANGAGTGVRSLLPVGHPDSDPLDPE